MYRRAKGLAHQALYLHQVLNVTVSHPNGASFPRQYRVLTILAAWGAALATAVWLSWNRMKQCCVFYAREFNCDAPTEAFCVVEDVQYPTCGSLQMGIKDLPTCTAFPHPGSFRDTVWVALLAFIVAWPMKKILSKMFQLACSDLVSNYWVRKNPAEQLRDTFNVTLLRKQVDSVMPENASGNTSQSHAREDNAMSSLTSKGEGGDKEDFEREQASRIEAVDRLETFKRRQELVHSVGLKAGDILVRGLLIGLAAASSTEVSGTSARMCNVLLCDGEGDDNDDEETTSFMTRVDADAAAPLAAGTLIATASFSVERERLSGVQDKVMGWKVASVYRTPLVAAVRGVLGLLAEVHRVRKLDTDGNGIARFPAELVAGCSFLQIWWRMMRDGRTALFIASLAKICRDLDVTQTELLRRLFGTLDVDGSGTLDENEIGFLLLLGQYELSAEEESAFVSALLLIQSELGTPPSSVENERHQGNTAIGFEALRRLILDPPRRNFCVSLPGENLLALGEKYGVPASRLGQLNKSLVRDSHRGTPNPMFSMLREELPCGMFVNLPAPLFRGTGHDRIISAVGGNSFKGKTGTGAHLRAHRDEFEDHFLRLQVLENWLKGEQARMRAASLRRRTGLILAWTSLVVFWCALTWAVLVFGLELYTLIGEGEELALFFNFFAALVVEILVLEWQRVIIAIILGILWAWAIGALGGPDVELQRMEKYYDEVSVAEQKLALNHLAAASNEVDPDRICHRQFANTAQFN